MAAILRPQPQPEVDQHEQPAHQAEQQRVPEPWRPHPLPEARLPAPDVNAQALLAWRGPEHVLRQECGPGGLSVGSPLAPHLLQGAVDQRLELAQIVGEVVDLQPLDHRLRDLRGIGPAELAAALTHAVAEPLAQVLAPHPQGRHADQAAGTIKSGRCLLRGEEHTAGEMTPGSGGITIGTGGPPLPGLGQMQQQRPQVGRHLIELVDQQGAASEQLQQRSLRRVGHSAEQIGAVRPQQGTIELQHQLVASGGAEVDQGRQVVLLQAGLSTDQHRPCRDISGGEPHRLAQAAGITTAADHAAPGSTHQQRRQPQQLGRLSQR